MKPRKKIDKIVDNILEKQSEKQIQENTSKFHEEIKKTWAVKVERE